MEARLFAIRLLRNLIFGISAEACAVELRRLPLMRAKSKMKQAVKIQAVDVSIFKVKDGVVKAIEFRRALAPSLTTGHSIRSFSSV